MLDFYTDFLLTSFGGACATNLSRLSDGTISHDRVIRFPKRRGATPYIAKKIGKPKRRSAIIKNERFRMLLHVCHHNQLRFKYVLFHA